MSGTGSGFAHFDTKGKSVQGNQLNGYAECAGASLLDSITDDENAFLVKDSAGALCRQPISENWRA